MAWLMAGAPSLRTDVVAEPLIAVRPTNAVGLATVEVTGVGMFNVEPVSVAEPVPVVVRLNADCLAFNWV